MKNIRKILSILLLLITWNAGAVDNVATCNYTFRQITVLDGLPDDAIKDLFLLPDGRLGIRSTYGLSFYDGCDFRNFPLQVSPRIYSLDYISANPNIYVDKDSRIWTKETGRLSVFDIMREMYINNVDSLLRTVGVREHIRNLFIDHGCHFCWVTSGGKLWYRNIEENASPRQLGFSCKGLRDVAVYDGKMWLVYDNGMLICSELRTGRILRRERLWETLVEPRYPVAFRQNAGELWVLWKKGIALWNRNKSGWERLGLPEAAQTSTINLEGGSGGWGWVGIEQKGLFLVNGLQQSVARQIPLVSTMGDSFENDVQSIFYNSSNGNLWLGLYTRGLAYFNPSMEMLPMLDFRKKNIAFDNNLQITPLRNGKLLLITSPQPLFYEPLTGNISPAYPQLNDRRCISAYEDSKGRLWVGTFRKGFYEIKDGSIRLHNITASDGDVAFNLVRGFIEDDRQRLFVNFHGGLGLYNEKTQLIEPLYKRHPELKPYFIINRMAKAKDGCLWIAARQGVYKYDPLHDKVYLAKDLAQNEADMKVLGADSKAMFCDSRGLVWFGTNMGLHIWNAQKRRFENVPGLPENVIQSVVEDTGHNIWVSTANGLCRIVVSQKPDGEYSYSLQFFSRTFRLKDSEFLANSAYADTKGNVYLGCTSGLYVIPPSAVRKISYTGHPLLTSFYLYDKEVLPGMEFNKRVILENSLVYTKRIRLSYDENFFTLHFSGLNFADPEHTYYRYRLKGIDKNYIEICPKGGKGVATYTNLSPGSYVFEVWSAGADKHWSKEAATLEITIDAPLWATWWAKLFYVLLVAGGVIYYFRYREIRNKVRLEHQKEKELDEMKYRFFTNISHEFRTLLTLIITPLGSVMKKMDKGALQDELKLVSRNASDLLQLVNQLLDFRKLEMSGEKLSLLNGNIGDFVEMMVVKFHPLAEQKNIRLSFSDESKGLYMFFDRDKLHKIIDNLLSNAFKFTPSGGSISVVLRRVSRPASAQDATSSPLVELEVTDTGCGMSEESMKHIFDRFYRVEKEAGSHIGSGIGLNLVQEYVKLHKGSLRVKSKEGEGSSFFLTLPIDLKPEVTQAASEDSQEIQEKSEAFSEKNEDSGKAIPASAPMKGKTLLLVEDNEEFRRFMARELAAHYKVIMAVDGIDGSLKAEENNPDLIISDIMMPRMNGIDLCERIKSCLPTSHIPVILLTAKGSDRTRAEGYEAGADAYISKPFDMEVLLARIQNLLKKQNERQQEFTHSITLDPKQVSITSKDEEFMKEAIAKIEEKMSDPDYMTDNLASDMAMSRMSLYRKVKAVTGQTPADFIRTVRLKYAAKLLKSGGLSVTEVCMKTGFATPQNFTKRFREMFGVVPSQYK